VGELGNAAGKIGKGHTGERTESFTYGKNLRAKRKDSVRSERTGSTGGGNGGKRGRNKRKTHPRHKWNVQDLSLREK